MTKPRESEFNEKLWPSPWLLITLLLLIPAVTMVILPLNQSLAVPLGVLVYAIIAGSLTLMAPSIRVRNGMLHAGGASIPLSLVGETETLDESALRRVIGPGADARAYLLVRGHIHRGVRLEIRDETDPTPYWVLTTRKPQTLVAAISAAKAAV